MILIMTFATLVSSVQTGGREPAALGTNAVHTALVNIYCNTARIRIFDIQVKTQHRVKTKLHDKQIVKTVQ